MTEDDLKAIEQRVNADPMKHLTLDTECAMEEVIAHARLDVPALVAEVWRLREVLRRIATEPTFPPFAGEILQDKAADAIGIEREG